MLMVDSNNEGPPVTGEQRQFLETATQRGYFEVPRETTLQELADEHGISSQEASELLCNVVGNVVTEEVLEE